MGTGTTRRHRTNRKNSTFIDTNGEVTRHQRTTDELGRLDQTSTDEREKLDVYRHQRRRWPYWGKANHNQTSTDDWEKLNVYRKQRRGEQTSTDELGKGNTTRRQRTHRKNSTFIETNGEVTRHQRMNGKTRPDVNGRTGEARRLSTPTEKENRHQWMTCGESTTRLTFKCTNNMAEYEACIMGLEEAIDLRIKYLDIYGDLAP